MRQCMRFLGKVVESVKITIIIKTFFIWSTYSDFAAVRTVLGLKCTFTIFLKSFQSKSVSLGYCPGNLNYLMKNFFQLTSVLPVTYNCFIIRNQSYLIIYISYFQFVTRIVKASLPWEHTVHISYSGRIFTHLV